MSKNKWITLGGAFPSELCPVFNYLTRKGIISPKLQLLSGHSEEKSLAIYRDLALADVAEEYESAMQLFPIR